jgi:L-fuculose-phosphate aldolase
MSELLPFQQELIAIGRRLDERRMIAGTDGNISMRLNEDRVLITPSGRCKGRLNPDELLVVDLDGQRLKGDLEPSSESLMHLYVYRRRPDVNACVHAHPPHATAFAVTGQALTDNVLPEMVIGVGTVPLTNYAPPGTEAVPQSLEPHIAESNAFLLRNHGLLTLGRTLEEAYNRHETVEHFARILSVARQLGEVDLIPAHDIERLVSIRTRLFGSPQQRD